MIRKFRDKSSPVRLAFLTLALTLCFFLWRSPSLSREETGLYDTILAAQNLLWSQMEQRGQADRANDRDRSGFIGLEWSEISTTLGNLDAKRNSADPLWGVAALRWFDQLGLVKGDRIVVASSSSFPGLLYSVLAAAESRGLQVDLMVSLGSSSWGGNRPEAPWPVLAQALSSRGFLKTRPIFYTLGGGGEIGRSMPEEGIEILTQAARADHAELYVPQKLTTIIDRKMAIIEGNGSSAAKLVISIGGSQSSLGTDDSIVNLKNGLLTDPKTPFAGNGVIARSLEKGIPVVHFLNLRSLAERMGISFLERRPTMAGGSFWPALIGLFFFGLVLATHKRWSWDN